MRRGCGGATPEISLSYLTSELLLKRDGGRQPMIHLGWKAGVEQYPPLEILDYAVAADEAGFDLIDVSDHFQPWSQAGQSPFTWTWLGAVAARTSRIHLGAGTTCPLLR